MKKLFYVTAFAIGLASPGWADSCYADYKAKQDDPLRLHYGVIELSGDCSKKAAKAELRDRLAAQGWTLLTVLSTFGAEGLDERKVSAGDFYLRY